MQSKIGGDVALKSARAIAGHASSILVALGMIWLASGSARADDNAALQRLEARMQELEARHESEIKTLQAEIRRLRQQRPATAAAAQSPATRTAAAPLPAAQQQSASSILPPGLPPPATPAQMRGAQLFQFRCSLCHAVRGTPAGSRYGPDLSHIASRRMIAAGMLPNNPGTLAGWIENPQAVKPGALMPNQHLSGQQLTDVTAYLETLK